MLIYRRALAVAAASAVVLSLGAAAKPAAPEACGPCIEVTVNVQGLPRVGERAGVEIVVSALADREKVDVQVELPAQFAWVKVPPGMAQRDSRSRAPEDHAGVHRMGGTYRVKGGAQRVLIGEVLAVSSGQAHIRVGAATRAPEIAADAAFLTVGRDVTTLGFASDTEDAAVPMAGNPTRAYPRDPVKPAGTSSSPGTTCATGSFGYVDTDGAGRIAANIGVQVWDADAAGGDDLLASGVGDAGGGFRLCFANADEEGGGQDIYVVFSTDNPHWVIRHTTTRAAYRFRTSVVANVTTGSTVAFGQRQPGNPALMRAVQAFDQVGAGWNWTPGSCWDALDTVCRKAFIAWATDSKEGTWYDTRQDSVFLLADDPRSAELVLHEFGHLIMDDIYEEAFPNSPKCNPHYIPRVSSRGCAWTEGFATLYEVMVLGEPIFRWADGRTLDVEEPTWGTEGWDNGDRVEGRVLGAMIDLYDSDNEGLYDRCTEDPRGPIWTTILKRTPDSFAQFWSARAAEGYDTSRTALACLYQNTIVYGGFRP